MNSREGLSLYIHRTVFLFESQPAKLQVQTFSLNGIAALRGEFVHQRKLSFFEE